MRRTTVARLVAPISLGIILSLAPASPTEAVAAQFGCRGDALGLTTIDGDVRGGFRIQCDVKMDYLIVKADLFYPYSSITRTTKKCYNAYSCVAYPRMANPAGLQLWTVNAFQAEGTKG